MDNMNHYQIMINEMKKMMSFILILVLTPTLVLATSAFIEYEGTGSATIKTEITSETKPDINDEVNLYAPPCPCCEDPDCDEGSYEGTQYMTNSPYSLVEDYTEIEDGCVSFDQEIIHDKGDQEITTNYQTLLDGTGVAYSLAAATPIYGSGYQYVDGSGDTWIYYGQSSQIDGEFDYKGEYAVGRLDCESGYFKLRSQYELTGPFAYHDGYIEAVCDDTGCYYIYFLGETTDVFGNYMSYQTQYFNYVIEVENEGSADQNIGIVTDDDSSVDFEVVLG